MDKPAKISMNHQAILEIRPILMARQVVIRFDASNYGAAVLVINLHGVSSFRFIAV